MEIKFEKTKNSEKWQKHLDALRKAQIYDLSLADMDIAIYQPIRNLFLAKLFESLPYE